jgi:hypothetical protein
MIVQVSQWIAHSDGKTGILAASVVVVAAGSALFVQPIADATRTAVLGPWVIVALTFWAVSLIGVLWNVDRALRPVVSPSTRLNPYSWPDLSTLQVDLDRISLRDDYRLVEDQVVRLSCLAGVKFKAFGRAMSFAWIFFGSTVALSIFTVFDAIAKFRA